jgi:hypothetical protein
MDSRSLLTSGAASWRRFAGVLLALAALFALAAGARASIRPEDRARLGRATLVAPAEGERVVESAVRFAFEIPRGTTGPSIVLSRRAFDPSAWNAIPDDPELTVRPAERALLSLEEAGVRVDSDTRLWWAIAVRDAATGELRVSAVRSFTALRKFANRIALSPYLPPAKPGRLDAGDVIGTRAARPDGAIAGGTATGTRQAARIRLAAGYDFAPASGPPVVPAELSSARVPREEGDAEALESYLVQFDTPPGEAEVAAITSAGGAVFGYIPDQAYLVRMSAAGRAKLASAPGPAWIGDYQPAYKLSPYVNRSAPGTTHYVALLFPDADLAQARSALTALGALLTDDSDNGINKLVRFHADGAQVAAAAALSGVAWIEPVPHLEFSNDRAQWVVQTNLNGNRRVWDMGIRGRGQVVMTSDSGILTSHDQFRDGAVSITNFGDYPTHRKIIAYKKGSNSALVGFGDHSSASYHGTHTAGTIAGNDDPVSSSTRDGMAKDAKIYFMDIGGDALGTGLDTFADLNDLFLPAYVGNDSGAARVSSHSWGGGPAGAYTLNSMQVDQFIWNHPDFYIAFANGNAGPSIYSVDSPATSKNSTGTGATGNGTSSGSLASFSSRGPTSDGRRKPTISAPGAGVTSSVGPTNTGYASYNGTSMATPAGAGAVALIREYLTEGWYPTGAAVTANGFSPSAALLKAMAINSAENLTSFTAPDNNIGWGRINDDNVLYFAGDAKKLLLVDNTSGLANGQYIEYQVNVTDGSVPFKTSLCWTDFPGNPAAAVQLVNNLNLTVSKGAMVYKGSVYSGGVSVTGGVYDSLNVEENVLVAAPSTGIWTVRVSAPSVPIGPQPFALVMTGGVGNGAGALALDRGEYGSSSIVELEVIDSNAGPTSVDVSVTSSTEGTPETVTLTGGSGVFHGTLALSPLLSSPNDGTLTVSNGDLITATYNDASPATTLNATALVNFDTPTITNVRATSQGAVGTLVTWTTNRNSTSRVYYGLTPALELGMADSAGAAIFHKVLLTGITPGQTYYYDVESVSLAGSVARDSLGGAHYRFTGKSSADILLLLNDPNFERTVAWTSALDAGGYDYDIWSGTLSDQVPLGGLSSGLRSYKAVLWQVGFYDYPPFSDPQRDTIDAYLAGGGRLATVGHDMGWGLADPSSPGYTPARAAWLNNTLHATFLADPATWSAQLGIASDPISGAYTGGVTYDPLGSGQSGDEVAITGGGGTGSYVWRDNDTTPDNDAFRWENSSPNGNPSTAFWGGTPSRLVNMFFEFTALRAPYNSPDAVRNDILDKTIVWLLGRARPLAAIVSPNGGENLTGNSTNISWTESVGGGQAVASRTLEYSTDGGDSWTLITSSPGTSPYSWDLTSVPNTSSARVRIRITDDGAPALGASDASNAVFTVNRGGGDGQGPVVVAGSIGCTPNPIVRGNPATLTARVSDALTGGGTVSEAEWSYGDVPGAPGHGGAMSGSFGTSTVDVSAAINTDLYLPGMRRLWVRARDAAGNWGPWSALSIRINGTDPVGVGDEPTVSFLAQNAPNPFGARTSFRFGLASAGEVALEIYDTQGRRVRQLVQGTLVAGLHVASWDGADDRGVRVRPGVYYYRLITPGTRFEKRLVRLE